MKINKPNSIKKPREQRTTPSFFDFMLTLSQIIKLSLFMVLTSLPLVTIGLSITAGYRLCFEVFDEAEDISLSRYLVVFRENMKKGIALWILLVFFAVILYIDQSLIPQLLSPGLLQSGLYGIFFILSILLLWVFFYSFPLLSIIENTIVLTLRNALYLSIRFIPHTLLVTLIHGLPILFYILFPAVAFRVLPLYILLFPGFVVYFSAKVFWHMLSHFELGTQEEHSEH